LFISQLHRQDLLVCRLSLGVQSDFNAEILVEFFMPALCAHTKLHLRLEQGLVKLECRLSLAFWSKLLELAYDRLRAKIRLHWEVAAGRRVGKI
jgi:hypothetical protein